VFVRCFLSAATAAFDDVPVAYGTPDVTTVGTAIVNTRHLLTGADSFAFESVSLDVSLQDMTLLTEYGKVRFILRGTSRGTCTKHRLVITMFCMITMTVEPG
jgi:hypothetical protein